MSCKVCRPAGIAHARWLRRIQIRVENIVLAHANERHHTYLNRILRLAKRESELPNSLTYHYANRSFSIINLFFFFFRLALQRCSCRKVLHIITSILHDSKETITMIATTCCCISIESSHQIQIE